MLLFSRPKRILFFFFFSVALTQAGLEESNSVPLLLNTPAGAREAASDGGGKQTAGVSPVTPTKGFQHSSVFTRSSKSIHAEAIHTVLLFYINLKDNRLTRAPDLSHIPQQHQLELPLFPSIAFNDTNIIKKTTSNKRKEMP